MSRPDSPPPEFSAERRVPLEPLREFITRALVKKSMFQFDAQTVAERMLEADLRGLDQYGVRALPGYLAIMDLGDVDPRGRVLVERESPAGAVLDGSRNLGHVAATKAMQVAVGKARACGVGLVTVHHSQALGAASLYAVLAAKEGLIGFCTSSGGSPCVAAPGTAHPAVTNAAWAWAIPTADGRPIVIDVSCAAASWGQLQLLADLGLPMPPDVALDESGAPASHHADAKVLLPAGGAYGFGLGLIASLLSGGLAGAKLAHQKTRSASAECSEHLLLAIDLQQFTDPETFLSRAADARRAIQSLPPTNPDEPVRMPGDLHWSEEEARRERGIPLHPHDLQRLAQCAEKLKLPLPWLAGPEEVSN